ncbi:MAG: hypothetical protein HOI45_08440, partial [Rhodospirillaceae bacterium]|nr:hypothetical protein [Rhodospirillaceae bacterium]
MGNYSLPPVATDKEINLALIGKEVDRDGFIDGKIRERELKRQSDAIVARMERGGIKGRTERGELTIIGMVSGQTEAVADYRNCNLLPIQQSRNTSGMHKSISYCIDTAPRKSSLRMLVVSSGWCRFDEYRKHHKAQTRRMSKFAAHPKLKEFGINLIYYNVENTIKRDGVAMLNLHSHVLFESTRYLGKKKWKQFLEFARNFFPKGYVHDSKIQKAKEVVKYCFKPSEFKLMTDPEFIEFVHQVIGGRVQVDESTGEVKTRIGDDGQMVDVLEGPLKFYHPLGRLKKLRSELKANRQKLMKIPNEKGDWAWQVTEKKKPEVKPDQGSGSTENIVVAITRPMPKFTTRMEPCILAQGYSGDFGALVRKAKIEGIVSEANDIFNQRVQADAKEAEKAAKSDSSSMQHTTTTTVPVQTL